MRKTTLQISAAEQREWCGSDSANRSGKKLETLSAVVQYEGYCPGDDSVDRDGDGELAFCVGMQ